jgi:nitrous oxidase accessory protein
MNNYEKRITKACVSTMVIIFMMLTTLTATLVKAEDSEFEVEIIGPSVAYIGQRINFELEVSDGRELDDSYWRFGDGSGSSGGDPLEASCTYTICDKDNNYTVTVVSRDENGNVCFDFHKIKIMENPGWHVDTESLVKKSDEMFDYGHHQHCEVGDILNRKIKINYESESDSYLQITSSNSPEFKYVNGSVNIEPKMFHPGDGNNAGPHFYWVIDNLSSSDEIIITYELEVVSEYKSGAYYLGQAFSIDQTSIAKNQTGSYPIIKEMDYSLCKMTIAEESGNIIYVDSNGGSNFTSIQEAIDFALPGDTIIVKPGVYHESVTIDKSIDVLGQHDDVNNTFFTESTIIDANGFTNGVEILSDSVKFGYFSIINAGRNAIYIDSSNSVVLGNIIENENLIAGINLISGKDNLVGENKISDCNHGIYVNSGYNYLLGNHLEDNDIGMKMTVNALANRVVYNYFIDNGLNACDKNYDIYSNDWSGIYFLGSQVYEDVMNCRSGNFWDDYTGSDADEDGIGDTPYVSLENCNGGAVLDEHPLIISGQNHAPASPVDPHPEDGEIISDSTAVTLSVLVEDPDDDMMDVSFYLENGTLLGTAEEISSGERAELLVDILVENTEYKWYAIADDGKKQTSSEIFIFKLNNTNDIPEINIELLDSNKKIEAEIKNSGEGHVEDVDWSISAKGFGLKGLVRFQKIDLTEKGTIEELSSDENIIIDTGQGSMEYNLGFIVITVKVTYNPANGLKTIFTQEKALAMVLNDNVIILRALK